MICFPWLLFSASAFRCFCEGRGFGLGGRVGWMKNLCLFFICSLSETFTRSNRVSRSQEGGKGKRKRINIPLRDCVLLLLLYLGVHSVGGVCSRVGACGSFGRFLGYCLYYLYTTQSVLLILVHCRIACSCCHAGYS